MADSIDEFLDELGRVGRSERFDRVAGTIRFDLTEDAQIHHWLLDIEHGTVAVSRERRPADCIVHGEKALLDRSARGEANLTAAWLGRRLTIDGRLELFRLFERMLPGPPTARDPRHLARHGHGAGDDE